MNRAKRSWLSVLVLMLLQACGTMEKTTTEARADRPPVLPGSHVFGPAEDFIGSPLPDVGLSGLFPVRSDSSTEIAILANGDQAFIERIQALKAADTSIRIQALVFTGDESGQHVAELLKQKKSEGVDVRVIVDAFSNPSLQTQNLYFDLKQWGIEVEGYEAMLLQWINEIPVPKLVPHVNPNQLDMRYHEKLWIVDGETDHGVAITGGLNLANEYFRIDPKSPDGNWRDQDIAVRGALVKDMVTAFDRNFDHFVKIKKSRGIFDTNRYWDATRKVLDETGHIRFHFDSDPRLAARVRELAARTIDPEWHPAKARFFQNRPRLGETYIEQTYLQLIRDARREILIANAYFVPPRDLVEALKDAARRCVSVTLLSNSPETNDLPEITMAGRGYYRELLAVNDEQAVENCAGSPMLQIWEWQGRRPSDEKRTDGTMHSKYAVFDRDFSLVGSYNLDPRSARLNSESAVVFRSPVLSEQLAGIFLDHDLSYSRRILPAEAMEFDEPSDVIYRFRKSLGEAFKDEL